MNPKQVKILATLALEDSPKGMDELELWDKTGVGPGMLYAHLKELEDLGLVEGRWQNEDRWPVTGRPAPSEEPVRDRWSGPKPARNRYYRITPKGREKEAGRSLNRGAGESLT